MKKYNYEAVGYRVLIKPDEIEKQTKGGILLVQNEDQQRIAQEFGTVVVSGPDAFKGDNLSGEPWVVPGDRVLYSRYGGKFVPVNKDPNNEEWYVVVNDTDILLKVDDKEES